MQQARYKKPKGNPNEMNFKTVIRKIRKKIRCFSNEI